MTRAQGAAREDHGWQQAPYPNLSHPCRCSAVRERDHMALAAAGIAPCLRTEARARTTGGRPIQRLIRRGHGGLSARG